jgi:nitroimidazol reductase NimA-like FMN-containing flavoprotein (pyridoxamine 5'-phosphate oxidase superfamily)
LDDMTRDQIDELLGDSHIGRLCMAGTDGRPYAIPIPFCWTGGALYLRLPLTGRKGQTLAANDLVCFEVDHFTPTLDEYASVLIEGQLVEVTDLAEKARVKRANDAKYDRLRNGHRPGHGRATPLSELPMRKILVSSVSGRAKSNAPVLAEVTS